MEKRGGDEINIESSDSLLQREVCKCRCIAVGSEKKLVEGSLINVNVVDVMPNKNTQISGFVSERKPVPA